MKLSVSSSNTLFPYDTSSSDYTCSSVSISLFDVSDKFLLHGILISSVLLPMSYIQNSGIVHQTYFQNHHHKHSDQYCLRNMMQ